MAFMEDHGAPRLEPLPAAYVETRDALHRLASYVLAPARKAATGRIGLRATPGGFGTPPFGDGEQLRVEGASLVRRRGDGWEATGIASLAAAAAFAGIALSDDPGIGHDPPPLGDPDAPLAVSPDASSALGAWYGFSAAVLEDLRTELNGSGRECSEVQLWPEHFDLGCSIEGVNFGSSAGDGHYAEPYIYVGLWNTDELPADEYWNASFGAVLRYDALLGAADQAATALGFLRKGAKLAS
jgi:hypothetical protein